MCSLSWLDSVAQALVPLRNVTAFTVLILLCLVGGIFFLRHVELLEAALLRAEVAETNAAARDREIVHNQALIIELLRQRK